MSNDPLIVKFYSLLSHSDKEHILMVHNQVCNWLEYHSLPISDLSENFLLFKLGELIFGKSDSFNFLKTEDFKPNDYLWKQVCRNFNWTFIPTQSQ